MKSGGFRRPRSAIDGGILNACEISTDGITWVRAIDTEHLKGDVRPRSWLPELIAGDLAHRHVSKRTLRFGTVVAKRSPCFDAKGLG